MSFQLASHVIPPAAHVIPALTSGEDGIYARLFKKQESLKDGLNSYRSQAFAHSPAYG